MLCIGPFSHKKLGVCAKVAARRDPVTKQQTEQTILRYARHLVAVSTSRESQEHDRPLSELCILCVARSETARTPSSVGGHMPSVGHAGGGGRKGESCAARRSRGALLALHDRGHRSGFGRRARFARANCRQGSRRRQEG